eukprot:5801922-Pyramimonas_sp.AAC.1
MRDQVPRMLGVTMRAQRDPVPRPLLPGMVIVRQFVNGIVCGRTSHRPSFNSRVGLEVESATSRLVHRICSLGVMLCLLFVKLSVARGRWLRSISA